MKPAGQLIQAIQDRQDFPAGDQELRQRLNILPAPPRAGLTLAPDDTGFLHAYARRTWVTIKHIRLV